MELSVLRYSDNKESTLGLLSIGNEFMCYTLEDEERTVKKWGETRIPEGTYKIGLRTEGGTHKRYSAKYPHLHKGMLQVMDVPDFEYILIHVGNDDSDTAGCLLVGDGANNNKVAKGFISHSVDAYKRMYKVVSDAILAGEEVYITYS